MKKQSITDKVAEFKEFASKHNLKINPKRTFEGWAELILKLGHCLCDTKRKECPCAQALGEIKKNGRCRCKIFFSRKGMEDFYAGDSRKKNQN